MLLGGTSVLMTMPKVDQRKLGDIGEPPVASSELPHQPSLPSDVAACLGERLRACYSPLMKDPVPEHLIQILEAMDQKERTNGGR
jgi:hypothetical protein